MAFKRKFIDGELVRTSRNTYIGGRKLLKGTTGKIVRYTSYWLDSGFYTIQLDHKFHDYARIQLTARYLEHNFIND